MNKKVIMYTSLLVGVAAVGYYIYEKNRVAKINAKVDTLPEAVAILQNVK
jgi:hypothetical protein